MKEFKMENPFKNYEALVELTKGDVFLSQNRKLIHGNFYFPTFGNWLKACYVAKLISMKERLHFEVLFKANKIKFRGDTYETIGEM
jgi:hypothetical protein